MNFAQEIQNGINYLNSMNPNWLHQVNTELINVREPEPHILSVFGMDSDQIAYVNMFHSEDWLASHGFAPIRKEGDNRSWAEIARQINKEWRETIERLRGDID